MMQYAVVSTCGGGSPIQSIAPNTAETARQPMRIARTANRMGLKLSRHAPAVKAATVAFFFASALAAAPAHHSNPWLLSWIPQTCCVTNDCCWEILESELTPLPDDRYVVRSTGQVLRRTDWSPDGKFYRCACDHDLNSNHWVRHQGANTRCLFVPMRLF